MESGEGLAYNSILMLSKLCDGLPTKQLSQEGLLEGSNTTMQLKQCSLYTSKTQKCLGF